MHDDRVLGVWYVGSYTHASPTGLRAYAVDTSTDDGTDDSTDDSTDDGALATSTSSVDDVEHASFVVVHGRRAYAVSETDEGSVVAFDVDPASGALTEIGRASSHGAAPCHLAVDPAGSQVVVANYGSGTVAALGLDHDGRFSGASASVQHHGSGPHSRQDGPHAHGVTIDPSGRWVYAVDLGVDRIVQYELEPGGRGLHPVGEVAMPPGSGPRHLALHPSAPAAFVVCELDRTLAVLAVDPATGELTLRETISTLPADASAHDVAGTLAGAIAVHPEGHRVYVTNRGHDSIATFGFVDVDTPLAVLGHAGAGGRTPRHLAVHPSGRSLLVANQDSDTVVELALDPDSALPGTGGVAVEVPGPACIAFVAGRP